MTILAEPALITDTLTHPAEPMPPADTPDRTEQLLRQRDDLPAGHPDRDRIRARAIEENLPLAHRLARRYAGRGEPFDDLAQVAALALITAVDRYDPSLHTPFTAFAVPTIRGALKRHFRDTTWAMRVPRSTQELTRELTDATGELSQQQGRHPTTAELADHLHVTSDDLRAAIDALRVYHLTSLNAPHTAGAGVDRLDLLGEIDPRYAGVDDHLALRPLLSALPPRQRHILALRFFCHMTQTQIAAEIGVSQMQVSRLLKQTLARLRAGIAPHAAEPRAGTTRARG